MSEEQTLPKKILTKRAIAVILAFVLATGIISVFTLHKEHKMRRAVLDVEGLSFDGMEFKRCNDYKTLEKSEMICKTANGDWIVWSVEGYEDNLEYVYANCFMDGFFYERVN